MTPKVSRRTVVLSALVSGVSLYVGGWWGLKVRHNDSTDAIAAVVQRRLDYLQLDEQGVAAFAEDVRARLDDGVNRRLSWLGLVHPLYSAVGGTAMTPLDDEFRRFEEWLVARFLLSSDFFLHDADETRTIEYVGYYDPYERPCSNPLAHL